MVILFVEARKLVEKARKWRLNKSSVFDSVFFVPTPLEGGGGGGGGTIYSNGFFVQSILADRYIYRRELRLLL